MSYNTDFQNFSSSDMELLPPFQEIADYSDIIVLDPNFPPSPFDDEATLESTMQFKFNPATNEPTPQGNLPEQYPLVDQPSFRPQCPPDRTPLLTKYNFKVSISSTDVNKKKFLYSAQLNRMYVDMNCDFPVRFDWCSKPQERVFVRATMVFFDEENAQKRVERCLQHRHENNDAIPEDVKRHVLRSSREVGTSGVTYQGDPDAADSWYSVLVEMGACQSCSHAYKFVCKNSCNSGINRRATAIIFTLEDVHGIVLGRQMVGVRVCSCPRRDLHKDENGAPPPPGKRVASAEPPRAKKIKLEVVPSLQDDRVCTLPPLQVIGTRTIVAGLEMMVYMMEQARPRATDAQSAAYESCITAMQNTIQEVKNSDQ